MNENVDFEKIIIHDIHEDEDDDHMENVLIIYVDKKIEDLMDV